MLDDRRNNPAAATGEITSLPNPVWRTPRFVALESLATEIADRLKENGFTEPSVALPGNGGHFPSLARNGVHICLIPLDEAGLRVDVDLEVMGPETALFRAGSCGKLEFLHAREDFFVQVGEATRAVHHVLALAGPGEHLVARRGYQKVL